MVDALALVWIEYIQYISTVKMSELVIHFQDDVIAFFHPVGS